MKKFTAICFAAAMTVSLGAGASAQDTAANTMVSVPGLNLQVNASAKVKDDLLAGTEKFAQGASQVTEINLDPSTMSMMGRSFSMGGDLSKKMKLMVVHTYGYDKPGMYRMDDVETYAKKLQDGSWSCPITTREKDSFTYICTKTDSDHETNEMVIISAEARELTFIHMAGTMSLNDLTHMSDNAHGLTREVAPRQKFDLNMRRPVIVPPTPPVAPGAPALPALPVPPAQ